MDPRGLWLLYPTGICGHHCPHGRARPIDATSLANPISPQTPSGTATAKTISAILGPETLPGDQDPIDQVTDRESGRFPQLQRQRSPASAAHSISSRNGISSCKVDQGQDFQTPCEDLVKSASTRTCALCISCHPSFVPISRA
ncbi:hypothetical protein T440DRAFT_13124 [Plenodomus tracheiphilus IPT5]|uniref:Uncharacterized protein n=1 Tax=Plenodomus tracheiphilus IPT5 TaxID=1408161 RepID=A0A6A7BNC3_9PLEO|nr:hypothetical protein T440DRAFT_13124 [Plenodomus tracheiphilus IPT5]